MDNSQFLTTDFLIIGAGIMGLSIARVLNVLYPDLRIMILEKESGVGYHASGRNSGVLHSGIYYPENSLKAKMCTEGARLLASYCQENDLPFSRVGKVIVPVAPEQDSQLEMLMKRALSNGATVELVEESVLRKIEPEAATASGRALYSPNTAVFEPKAILGNLVKELKSKEVQILTNQRIERVDSAKRLITVSGQKIQYGYLYNTAGLHADRVAKAFDIGKKYVILPFKGLYYKLNKASKLNFNGLIYPVPDLRVPFLGVHFTKSPLGNVYIGPTAIPALGRENYEALRGIDITECPMIAGQLSRLYWQNKQGFREYAHQEAFRFFKQNFTNAAKALVPRLNAQDLLPCDKVGIRAQLLDTSSHELVMDFLVETNSTSTHVLNAVSPAFTSAFAFAHYLVQGVMH